MQESSIQIHELDSLWVEMLWKLFERKVKWEFNLLVGSGSALSAYFDSDQDSELKE